MKLLIVTQYFWPENMRINELAKDFSEKGYDVTVLTGKPNYPGGKVFEEYQKNPQDFQNYYGAKIVRVPMIRRGNSRIMLTINYISFFMSGSIIGLFKLRKHKFNNIFVFASSPIMSAIPAIVIGKVKKTPVFIWILDLWPESLEAVGVIKNKFLLKLVGLVVSWIYNRADYLLLQSKSFVDSVRIHCTKKIDENRLIYFPSWAEGIFDSAIENKSELIQYDCNQLTIVFAGNIGEAQDFPTIVDSMVLLKGKLPLRWVIAGEGRMFNWLKCQIELNKLDNVLILGRQPIEYMPALFASADALLVTLKKNEIFSKTIPGKIQAYLASGKPILGVIDGESAKIINNASAGFASNSGDAESFSKNIIKFSRMTLEERSQMGKNGKDYYQIHFSKDMVYNNLEELFNNSSLRR